VVKGPAVACFFYGSSADGIPELWGNTSADLLLGTKVIDYDSQDDTGFSIAKEPGGSDEELDGECDSFHNA